MDTRGDADLVAGIRAGDAAAVETLFRRYTPLAQAIAARVVGRDQAPDLAQEALLAAYLSLDRLRDPARFRSWLYGIVLNVCRNALRAQAGPGPASLESLAGGVRFEALPFGAAPPDPALLAEARELQARVFAAVQALPPPIRAATVLFYYRQLHLNEIAARLGISVGAVKSRLHEARHRLRTQLRPHYAAPAAAAPPERSLSIMVATQSTGLVPVEIADVVARGSEPDPQYVVVLWDAAGGRLLPIWVGPAEGIAIALGLRQVATPRPVTYPFFATVIAALGGAVEAIEIGSLQDDTFHATVRLRQGTTMHALDARPSDALALAVRTGSPIAVAPAVLASAGLALPAPPAGPPRGAGAAAIVARLEARWQQPPVPRPDAEALAEGLRALTALVFGPDAPDAEAPPG